MELKGKTAIITGGGGGICGALAIDLAKEGCNLVLSSKLAEELVEVSWKAKCMGVQVLEVTGDICSEELLEKIVQLTIKNFNTVDILVNGAGIIIPKPFLEATLAEWDATMNINLRSAFILSRKVLEIMKEKQGGYIINISSTAAFNIPSELTTYGISKCALKGMSEALYDAAKEFKVKVSTIYPGMTDTKMARGINTGKSSEKWLKPEDIAACIMFLLKQDKRVTIRELIPFETNF